MTLMLDMNLEEEGKRGWSQSDEVREKRSRDICRGAISHSPSSPVSTRLTLGVPCHAAHQRVGNGFSGIAA